MADYVIESLSMTRIKGRRVPVRRDRREGDGGPPPFRARYPRDDG